MNEIRNHRDLEAWHLAMDVVMETYDLTECFPAKEIYGLQSQMRRAAVSVPSNIAEGQARPLRASLNHLSIALGSLAELDTQLEIAIRREYTHEAAVARFRALHDSTRKLVFGLRRAKRRRLGSDLAGGAGLLLLAFYTMSRLLA